MDIHDLGNKLNDMYFNSAHGETVAMIHLFAIKYATEIKATGASMRTVAIGDHPYRYRCSELV